MKNVLYSSTRAVTENRAPVSFSEALQTGIASDGGLFVPLSFPEARHKSVVGDSYYSHAADFMTPFISPDFSHADVLEICRRVFDFKVPLVPLAGSEWQDCFVLELFHGPTSSFKDFGAGVMGQMVGLLTKSSNNKVIVLVATSGDTGSAVAHGFSNVPNVEVVLLYPAGQVSELQEKQLIFPRRGVTACRVAGSFDTCQRLVKQAFAAPELSSLKLTSANSINVGRLIPQMTYYSWAASRVEGCPTFCVPSGNLGNLTAGTMAMKAGVKAKNFIAAHNENSFFPDELRKSNDMATRSIGNGSKRTISNAMDVGSPSNFERLRHMYSSEELRALVTGYSISDEDTKQSMRRVYEETGYIADPHTSVALESVRRFRRDQKENGPVVILSTAHPAKFASAVRANTGQEVSFPESLSQLDKRPLEELSADVMDLSDSLADLSSLILQIAGS